MKNIFIGLLTILFLPVTALLSFLLIALTLAALILLSPLPILGGTIIVSSYLSEKITDWLFPVTVINFESLKRKSYASVFTSLGLTLVLIALTALPVAVIEAAVAILVFPLSIPILAVYGAFWTADKIVSTISPEPVKDQPINHSYHQFPLPEIESLNQKKPDNKPLKTAKEEPSSTYSGGLTFFAPLLECLRSLGGYKKSIDVEHRQEGPSPY